MKKSLKFRPDSFLFLFLSFLIVVLLLPSSMYAATYNLSYGQYPSCTTSWSVSGSTYTCTGNGNITLSSADVVIANTNAILSANNGLSITNATVGSTSVIVDLVSTYGNINITDSTIYGSLQSSSGTITLTNGTLSKDITNNGTTNLTNSNIGGNVSSKNGVTTNNTNIAGTIIATNGNIVLTGGTINGKVTSSSNTITANGTNLLGGALANSGISITNSTIEGDFSLSSNNTISLSGVTMPSGSISNTFNIDVSDSTLGSTSSPINVSAIGRITVRNSSVVYGDVTAMASWGTIDVDSTSVIYGNCSPNSSGCVLVPIVDLGPIIHYSFEDCTPGETISNVQDFSGGSNDGTGYNGLKCIATDTGKGAQFDGINDYAKSNTDYSFTYDAGYTVYSRLLIDSWAARRFWILYFGVPDAAPTCNNNGMHWLVNVGANVTCGEKLPIGTTQFGVFCGAQNRFVLSSSDLQRYISFATVYDAATKTLSTYMDGVKISSSISSTNPTSGTAPVYLGRPGPSWSCESSFKGIVDDVKIYPRTLSDDEIKQLFIGEGSFSATDDEYKTDFVYGNIDTKIVSQDFELRILARDMNNFMTYKDANISKVEVITCNDAPCTDWATTTRVINTKIYTISNYLNIPIARGYSDLIPFKFSKAYPHLRLRITGSVDNAQTFSTSLSKDGFAVRPKSFELHTSSSPYYAGENFMLFASSLDFVGNNTMDYNETKGYSFDINATVTKCLLRDLNVTNFSFENGQASAIMANYNDVGEINISIYEKVGNEYAKIDTGDANRFITSDSTQITVNPYELNITTAAFVASNGENWLYDARDVSDVNVTASTTVQANNKQHEFLLNFENACYSQDVNVTFYYDVTNFNPSVNISYSKSDLEIDKNLSDITDINKTFTIMAASFDAGEGNISYGFNIDKTYNLALNPIDINLTDVKVTSADIAKYENNITLGVAKTFYYARVKTADITTNQKNINHALHVEVYSQETLAKRFHQESLNWYVMADDNDISKIKDLNASSDFSNITNSNILTIDYSQPFSKGVLNFELQNSDEVEKAYVHVNMPRYLWYSRYKDYNASGDCSEHPCFEYNYLSDKSNNIHSGDFNGTSIGDYNATKTIRGVKVFR